MHRLGILLSGRGSNFLAIAEAIRSHRLPATEIASVISNIAGAQGLETARALGLPTFSIPSAGRTRAEHDADLVCLAGYMRIVSPRFVAEFPDRILNIHPSLLPAFPGLDAQAQALAAGVKVAGCTVHFVDEQVDHGAIVLQRAVPVLDDDTPEVLSARILAQEHIAYPEAIARVLSGGYHLADRRYIRLKT
jgi:phosphoribosylglycinamide formyltransferase-1